MSLHTSSTSRSGQRSRHAQSDQSNGNLASRVSQGVSRALPWRRPPPPPPGPALSPYSTHAVPDSGWCSTDFMFGAAMIIIQDNTHKVVVVHDKHRRGWFFPRGRKDIGESVEQAALREGHEESGYRVEFLPHRGSHHAPDPAHNKYSTPTCEALFITTMYWPPKYRNVNNKLEQVDYGGEYLITWFLGRIEEDAVRESGTGMEDEDGYEASLLPFDEAYERVPLAERQVLVYAWEVYTKTLELNARLAAQAEAQDSMETEPTSAADDDGGTPSTAAGSVKQPGEASVEELHM